MARLNEVDKYLLDKWRSVFALQAAWETLGSKIRKYLGEIYEEVKEKVKVASARQGGPLLPRSRS